MEKRKIINLAISLVLTIIAFATNTLDIFLIGVFVLLIITYVLVGVITLVCILIVNKWYKYLLETIEYIQQVEHEKHKTYFMLSGKELEEKICEYDKNLLKCHEHSKFLIAALKDSNKYLSKEKYDNVLEIEKIEIRETGRV